MSEVQGNTAGAVDEEPPLELRARTVLWFWHYRLEEWARTFVLALRAPNEVVRRRAAPTWLRINRSVHWIAVEARDLRLELQALNLPDEAFWDEAVTAIRRLPPPTLIEALIEGSERNRLLVERFRAARALMPMCIARGYLGTPGWEVEELMSLREAQFQHHRRHGGGF